MAAQVLGRDVVLISNGLRGAGGCGVVHEAVWIAQVGMPRFPSGMPATIPAYRVVPHAVRAFPCNPTVILPATFQTGGPGHVHQFTCVL